MKSFFAAALLIASSTAADVPPRPLVREAPACRVDSECVLTHFQGCCGGPCCPTAPRAMASADLKRQQDRCAVVDCARPSCPDVKCAAPEPDSTFRAVCRQGACVAERAVAECRSDADCTVDYPAPACRPGPCGCCPGTEPHAIPRPVERDEAPTAKTAPQTPPKQSGDVKFGLSQPDAPACAPCAAPRPATATCSSGRCVLAPQHRPRPRPPG